MKKQDMFDGPQNFNVVVPTFQVEGKHICTPREDIAVFQSLYSTCILPRNLLTYLKSRTSLFFPLAWTDTDKGLTTRGGTLVSTKRPDWTNSWIASSTNSACERDDVVFYRWFWKTNERWQISPFYNVKNKTRSSNTLPKFDVSSKLSLDVDTRRTST